MTKILTKINVTPDLVNFIVEISSLFHPDTLFEIEAIAVKNQYPKSTLPCMK